MRVRTLLTALLTTVAAMSPVTAAHSAPAPSAAARAQCPQGHICLWEHADFQGFQWGGPPVPNEEPNGCHDFAELSPGSVINNSDRAYYVFREGSCTNPGRSLELPIGESPRFPWRIGSVSWCRSC
ncbi:MULTISPECIES: peptidase inhibitor family I36 protein [Streptomyces]|uniref:Peptidase inhibitor family I36 protein n=1 Tax=Streptomyces koelreuteriae TaxID=2838015 RepID=A0ABX8G278_9ACTN|nr:MULTISPECIES: peptidase inhibitor family I36 protein [Streptomyces]QWB27466.1 peptidase inhibitor family I36 protein [Streptomyces koelreuteriae]UUA10554.1 peptidase inhibitor family I36 protein [Streptomyces koelreuteriae]UUA18161.1 peptidase inhibitor family I36 protein [Streptomyces sp. CRCS-T-1]